jgi:hypothetical protein
MHDNHILGSSLSWSWSARIELQMMMMIPRIQQRRVFAHMSHHLSSPKSWHGKISIHKWVGISYTLHR